MSLVLVKPCRRQYTTSMKKIIIAIFLSLIWTPFCVVAQERPCSAGGINTPRGISTYVPGGIGSGEEYLEKMTARDKSMYAMGALNGMVVAGFFGAPEKCTKWLEDYTKGMTPEQLAAIITKYLKDNPGDWHLPLNVQTYNAILEAYNKEYPPAGK
jgi:hypothetical protein